MRRLVNAFLTCLLGLFGLSSFPMRASAADCTTQHPNIILFIADDLGTMDLPFFNAPIQWTGSPSSAPTPKREYALQRPPLNRLAARLLADPNTGEASFQPPPLHPNDPPPPTYNVVPVDATSMTTHAYQTPVPSSGCGDPTPAAVCDPKHDVLEGHGGLNRLASDGFMISRHYAPAALCAPTRASILTGRHTRRTTVTSNSIGLPGHEITIAEYLQQGPSCGGQCYIAGSCAGAPCYDTALIGKWHLGEADDKVPTAQGFNTFYGHNGGHRSYFSKTELRCTDEEAEASAECINGRFPIKGKADGPNGRPCNDTSDTEGCSYSTRIYRDRAIDFINAHDDGEPFFLVVTFNAVHAVASGPRRTTDHYTTVPGHGPKPRGKAHWAVLEEMDAAIGQILDEVDWDDTVVFFTSDHGAPHADYGIPMLRGGKRNVYEGGVRVGLLGMGCGIDADNLVGHVTSHVDLFPTIAEAAGFPVPQDNLLTSCDGSNCTDHYVDGRSFYSLLDVNPTGHLRDRVYARMNGHTVASREMPISTAEPGVCGYVGKNESNTVIRGGSCAACQSDTDCTAPGGGSTPEPCKVLGKVCVSIPPTPTPPDGRCVMQPPVTCSGNGDCNGCPQGTCVSGKCECRCVDDAECASEMCRYTLTPNPTPVPFKRCVGNADCASGQKCKEITVSCNRCFPSAWKVRSGDGPIPACNPPPTPKKSTALFDLSSNPEEDERLNCAHAQMPKWCELERTVQFWNDCTTEVSTEACEDRTPTPMP